MAITEQHSAGQTSALQDALLRIRRRLRFARWVRHAARGALAGAGVSLLALMLFHTGLLPETLPLAAQIPLFLLLGVAAGTVTAWVRPIPPMDAARVAETRLGLKERLSSALEMEQQGPLPARDPEAALLRRLQQEDAATHARSMNPADAVPLRATWEIKALAGTLLVLLLALLLPALPAFTPPRVRAERAIVRRAGEKLIRTARLIAKHAQAQHLEGTRRAALNMQHLGRTMAAGRMDKKQAFLAASRLTRQMAEQQRQIARQNSEGQPAGKSLAQAGGQLAQSLAAPTPAAEPGSRSAPQTSGPSSTRAMQQAAQALRENDAPGLSEQLHRLAQQAQAGRMTPAEQQQTARDLQKLSQALQGTPLSQTRQHAQTAADAMKQGDTHTAADELRKAADAAQRESQPQADQQGMQQAQSALQSSRDEMAQASRPEDIGGSNPSGRQGASGPQGQEPGKAPGQGRNGSAGTTEKAGQQGGRQGGPPQGGAPGNQGTGRGGPNTPGPGHYASESGVGYKTPGQNMGIFRGAVHPLNPRFDPRHNANYGRIYLGRPMPGSAGGARSGPLINLPPGAAPAARTSSSVPYYNYAAPARKSAETAMDKEDIPPAYRSDVSRYFNGIQPGAR